MLKKSASIVLASLRGSTYRSVRLASSLAAALLDSLFEHPDAMLTSTPLRKIILAKFQMILPSLLVISPGMGLIELPPRASFQSNPARHFQGSPGWSMIARVERAHSYRARSAGRRTTRRPFPTYSADRTPSPPDRSNPARVDDRSRSLSSPRSPCR